MKLRKAICDLATFYAITLFMFTINALAQGNALKLEGKNSAFTARSPSLGSICTIELWVYPNSYPARRTFLYTSNSSPYNYFREWTNSIVIEPSGKVFFYIWDGRQKMAYGKRPISTFKWTHIAGVLNMNYISLYINGFLKSTTSIGKAYRNLPIISINGSDGHRQGWDGKFYGQIDELRVWNRVLSQTEIQANMKKELRGDEMGLVAYYKFDESKGNVAHDASPRRHNQGQLIGNANFVPSTAPIHPPHPPELSVIASFSAVDGVFKAGQNGTIQVFVQNTGKGDAKHVKVKLTSTGHTPGLYFDTSNVIGAIAAGKNGKSSFILRTDEMLPKANIAFTVNAIAEGGYSASTSITVPTQPFYSHPKYPADLYVENIRFIEPSGNNALDGYESGKIEFTLSNKGRGEAQNIHISLSPLGSAEGLSYAPTQVIERIDPKTSLPVTFSIAAAGKVSSLARTFRIQAVEEFGFDADPARMSFETRAFEPPDLRIEKVAINDRSEGDAYGNGNSIIEPNESIVVTAFVQNFGTGAAEQVRAKIHLEGSDPNLQCPDNSKILDLATIQPGDYKPVSFYFFTSKRYSREEIPIEIILTESRGDYGKTVDLGLKMNERTPNIVDINVARIELPKPAIKAIAEAAKSDVDEILQKSKNNEPDDFAVIIGIENYKYAPMVTYAERDAGAFYNYAVQVLGIPERNIYYLVNDGATSGEFKKLFEKDGWIARRATTNSDIFVYYSGHGAPNLKDNSPYIIPYDIDPNYANTGFALSKLYETLGGLNVKSATVFLDACFSGQSREKEMLLADARPVFIKVVGPLAFGNLTVLAAASGSEISSGYPEQRHGIFTYFLLKGLQGYADENGDKRITVNELFNYVKPNVMKVAGALDREQTPSLMTKTIERILVTY